MHIKTLTLKLKKKLCFAKKNLDLIELEEEILSRLMVSSLHRIEDNVFVFELSQTSAQVQFCFFFFFHDHISVR